MKPVLKKKKRKEKKNFSRSSCYIWYFVKQQCRNPEPGVCSECSFGLRWQLKQAPYIDCHSCVPQTIKWQLILWGCCHLWSGPSSGVHVSSRNEGCHLQWLYCLLLRGSQWHLSENRVRRRTWCNSTSTWGCITTTSWTGLIKNCTRDGRILFFKSQFYKNTVLFDVGFFAQLNRI